MFYVGREKPWHGLGVSVDVAPDSREALIKAGLDWDVVQKPVYTQDGVRVPGYKANVRMNDGSGAIKIAMTPIRVVCNNTLNLALSKASRVWSFNHTGDIESKLDEAKETMFMAENYMSELGKEFEKLSKVRVSDASVEEYIKMLLPIEDDASVTTEKNILKLREDIKKRYFHAPDLKSLGKNGYRFVNAVSDFATHAKPLRETRNYRENLFNKTMEGNPITDRAHKLVLVA